MGVLCLSTSDASDQAAVNLWGTLAGFVSRNMSTYSDNSPVSEAVERPRLNLKPRDPNAARAIDIERQKSAKVLDMRALLTQLGRKKQPTNCA